MAPLSLPHAPARRRPSPPAAAAGRRPRALLATSAALAFCCVAGLALALSAAFVTGGPLWRGPDLRRPGSAGREAQSRVARHQASSGRSEWRLGLGKAIDVLRADTVALFDSREDRNIDFSIFSEDVEVADARLPSFRLRGLATYQRVLSTLRWSVRNACAHSRLEIIAISQPVNNEVYMRWRLHLWPRDPFAATKGFLAPLGGGRGLGLTGLGFGFGFESGLAAGMPFTVEGYSRYEFDAWTAEIVKHTIDITNPPMYLDDLLRKYVTMPSWLASAPQGVGVPSVMHMSAGGEASALLSQQAASWPASAISSLLGGGAPPAARGDRTSRGAGSWSPVLPQSCEDDFECNGGKANFPLQCCELPILGRFCCRPDDGEDQRPHYPAYVPLPVPVQDPWTRK